MKVGINLPSQFPFGSTAQMLEVYEQVGFDSYWSPDHILGVFHPGLWSEIPLSDLAADPDAFYDPFCYGAVVGTMTDRPFGISVTDATRRGAADLARTALTLNDLNPGGFILGIGSGEAESLVPFGYPFDKPVSMLEDVLRDLRSLLDHGVMADGGVGRMGLPLAGRRPRQPAGVGGRARTADAAPHRRVRRRLDPRMVDDARGVRREAQDHRRSCGGRGASGAGSLAAAVRAVRREQRRRRRDVRARTARQAVRTVRDGPHVGGARPAASARQRLARVSST